MLMTDTDIGHICDPIVASSGFEPFRRRAQAALFSTMPEHIERLGWTGARIGSHQLEGCRALLESAIERSSFHRRRVGHIDPSTFELDELATIPVMTKGEMMSAFDAVVTDVRVTLQKAERAIEMTTTTPLPIDGEFIMLSSGGSTGRRGLFVYDAPAFATFGATLMRPTMARLQAMGGPPAGGMTMAMVAAQSAVHATGSVPRMLDGSLMHYVSVPVTQPIAEIVDRLNQIQPQALYGYPSVLARLALEQDVGRLRISPMSVTATSETLRPDLRLTIRQAFGVPIINTFGSSEGLVGVSPPDDEVITFADDASIVELVDYEDQPVKPGAVSSSVLVTNLYNHVQPLIRYRIEDCFVRRPDATEHGHLRAEVNGRAADTFRFGSIDVHPHVIASALARAVAVADYQVRQTTNGVVIDVVLVDNADTERIARQTRDALAQAGLDNPTVHVTRVDELPRHPKTGKLSGGAFVPLLD